MLLIKNQKDNCNCLYKAHVWLDKHSIQSGCFTTKESAEQWAEWLHRKVVTSDMFRKIRQKD